MLLSQKKQKINPDQTDDGKLPGNDNNPGQKPRPEGRKARILVAPLDWGLGHATRCIPVIRELLAQNVEVWLASEGSQEKLLRLEFPDLPFLQLTGYRVKYAATAMGLAWKMLAQSPRLTRAIKAENLWLKKKVEEYRFDAVISDNRFGLYHPSVPCIFITHQLIIKTPFGKWSEKIIQKRNYRYINRFSQCWVPDLPGNNNLAGDLSHPEKKPDIPLYYIGILSRFAKLPLHEKKGHLLITLSGPEPQRSLLENIILRDIIKYEGTATIVRGLPGDATLLPSTNQIRIYNHLAADRLNEEMQSAELVISRSGYSTAMDLATMQKKSILIPTPGQTEQEYLAKYFIQKEFASCALQEYFSLPAEVEKARLFPCHWPPVDSTGLLKQQIHNLLKEIL
ncbi:MAG TPA: glycosyltransferase [Chitinophagaceae bacterium]|nr:glycosyltransferase [Chitinophagaceae bacterium]